MHKRPTQISLHRRQRHPQLLSDHWLTQAFQAVQDKRVACPLRQTVEQTVDLRQCLTHQQYIFRRGHAVLGQSAQLFQIGLFQRATTKQVAQQAPGNRGKEGTGFFQSGQGTTAHGPDKGILSQVGGIMRAVETAIQPGAQPAMMVAVQMGHDCLGIDRAGHNSYHTLIVITLIIVMAP